MPDEAGLGEVPAEADPAEVGCEGAERERPSRCVGGPSPAPSISWGGTVVRAKSAHTVDWAVLRAIRETVGRRSDAQAQAQSSTPPTSVFDSPIFERERPMTAEDFVTCWAEVAEAEQLRLGMGPLSPRDREFMEVRVSQSMREVDPQCSGTADVDIWVHHMLLTRSSPSVMKAMLQINRLVEVSLAMCPGILVGLQHALEIARGPSVPTLDDSRLAFDATVSKSARLPFSELVGIFARKLWHLRPGAKDSVVRRPDFAYRTPDEFVSSIVQAMGFDGSMTVSCDDFLALCLGRREWEVTLHLYDLSRGLASALSPYLLRERVEGVWHTGLVVYGKEYYFGGDIYYDNPGETGFGKPRIAVHLGTTLRQRDELHAFIVDELKPVFTREAYDAARNNCNHFTDKLSMFLLGKHIPEEVLEQPKLMFRTSLGRTLRPILTRVLGHYFEPKVTAEEIAIASGHGAAPGGIAALGLQEGLSAGGTVSL